jgi:hypothetical protein
MKFSITGQENIRVSYRWSLNRSDLMGTVFVLTHLPQARDKRFRVNPALHSFIIFTQGSWWYGMSWYTNGGIKVHILHTDEWNVSYVIHFQNISVEMILKGIRKLTTCEWMYNAFSIFFYTFYMYAWAHHYIAIVTVHFPSIQNGKTTDNGDNYCFTINFCYLLSLVIKN